MTMNSGQPSRVRSLLSSLSRLPSRLLNLLPGPPDGAEGADPLLANLDQLPPQERAARRQAWMQRFRRGRGDGNG
ncbi:MAG: hypothetical protein ABIG85_08285 [Chloroflexota bacterium]